MRSQEIRDTFLGYFSARGHKTVKSSSLIPKDDPTILFTNAGMNQFKNVFLGLEKRTYNRAASVQKCVRVSGKHNDLETVGRTAKHHTFFEMLGNFSFGDYFKREAIRYAWELVTEVFGLVQDRFYVTVYLEDEEAYRIWAEDIGLPAGKIFRFGKKDNFWAMGETGPCGPCSEIHYDLGQEVEAGEPRQLIESGSDRFVELWNLVFMEFFQDESGRLSPLPSPSIDTGMGLERMAAVLQGKKSNFETDLFMPLIDAATEMAGREYPSGDEGDISVRVIADHVRAVTFLIGDGVTPANDGRGYVLRRLIRRAFRQGNLIGIEEPFLYRLVGAVGDVMKDAYPELLASMNYISRVCQSEEERFALALSSGLRYFEQSIMETESDGGRRIPGNLLFKLYDTFGFPLDLSRELAMEKGFDVDEPGFLKELEKQKERARRSWKGEEKRKELQVAESIRGLAVKASFYDRDEIAETRVEALVKDGLNVEMLKEGEEGELILSETPFYAEAGGAVGESGWLKGEGFFGIVEKAYYMTPAVIAQKIKVVRGEIRTGQSVEARVDRDKRESQARNHTATHLLHAALRQVLGDHVRQAGSFVSPSRFRFDFNHFAALTKTEIRRIEELVNEKIMSDLTVTVRITSLEEGLKEGAMAIFEEKYGEQVRLVSVGGFSKELCGGIHVRSSGEIGFFKIISESGIAAGMRRIEAVTGKNALEYFWDFEQTVEGLEKELGSGRHDLAAKVVRLKDQAQLLEKEAGQLRRKLAEGATSDKGKSFDIAGIPVLVRRVEGLDMAELRDLADTLKARMKSGVVVLGQADDGKVMVVVSVTKDLTSRLQANLLINQISPVIDGGGGGRPDFAQAGGKKSEELDRLLESVPALIEKIVK